MQIKEQLIPKGTKRRSGIKMGKVSFFVDHDTGNPGSTAQNNADYYCRSAQEISASAHAFIDDKGVIICIPCHKADKEKAWHVMYNKPYDNELYGVDANDQALGFELCYFPNDKERSLKAYRNYIEFAAIMCKEHNIPPEKRSGHFQLDPQRRSDPKNALSYIGKTYADMIKDIKDKVEGKSMETKQIKVKLNGNVKQVSAINIDGYNYVKIQDLKDHYIDVSYDFTGKVPVIDCRASR